MSDTVGPDQTSIGSKAMAASTELVPLASDARWLPKMPLTRPDPSFLTQLIATAERVPQACHLRRATAAEARTAYEPRTGERRSVARRTRQIV